MVVTVACLRNTGSVRVFILSLQRLDGSIKGELRKQALDHFNAEGSEVCILNGFLLWIFKL